ncbi:TPA: hypothetical protein QDZ65_001500 [Stenotrophomonas maltophilia]|uniref:CPCC family cysteine-rich protein n=1 Tax=Stenotrophomonas maltophilia TaxID=40324 RepID=UPI000C267D6C|nr:hypothetical protein B9Y61_08640 [Stenotrophomonas maltophilia]HDS1074490.1 hypothetical protein [Stenotrophomonas maltophilia]
MSDNPDFSLNPCPCCGNLTISENGNYEICSICQWEDDPVQSKSPDYSGGANSSSLNVARVRWSTRRQD